MRGCTQEPPACVVGGMPARTLHPLLWPNCILLDPTAPLAVGQTAINRTLLHPLLWAKLHSSAPCYTRLAMAPHCITARGRRR